MTVDVCNFVKWSMGLVYNVIWDLSQLRNPSCRRAFCPHKWRLFISQRNNWNQSIPLFRWNATKASDVWEVKIVVATILQALWHNLSWKNVTKVAQEMISWMMDGGKMLEHSKNVRSWGVVSWLHHSMPLFGSGTYHMTVFRNVLIFTKIHKGLYLLVNLWLVSYFDLYKL